MKIYLAAAWSRKNEIAKVARELQTLVGPREIVVNSRWLSEPNSQYGGSDVMEFRRTRALIDVEDVRNSDLLVRFTDDLSHPTIPARLASGARMFEMGLAYALGKPIVVVGGYQPIFDYLPEIIHCADVRELKKFLTAPWKTEEEISNVRS